MERAQRLLTPDQYIALQRAVLTGRIDPARLDLVTEIDFAAVVHPLLEEGIPNRYSHHMTQPHHPHHIPTTSLFQPSYSYDVRSGFHTIGFQFQLRLLLVSLMTRTHIFQQIFLSQNHRIILITFPHHNFIIQPSYSYDAN